MIQYSALRKVVKPDANSVECLREWLDRPEGGDFFLKGREADLWEKVEDLVSLDCQQPSKDALTRLINEKFVPRYHRRWVHRFKVRRSVSDIFPTALDHQAAIPDCRLVRSLAVRPGNA